MLLNALVVGGLTWHGSRLAGLGSAWRSTRRALALASAAPPPSTPLTNSAPRPSAREIVYALGDDGSLVVSGATFPVKEGLKQMRFRWRPDERAWALPPGEADPRTVLAHLNMLAADRAIALVPGAGAGAAAGAPGPGPAVAAPEAVVAQQAPEPPRPPQQPPPLAHAPVQAAAIAPAAVQPVPARLPRAFSPSSIDTWRQCALLFRFRYVDKLPSPPSPEMTVGIAAHAALQHLYELPAAERDEGSLLRLLDREWSALLAKRFYAEPVRASELGEGAWLERTRGYLVNYLQLESPAALEPVALEQKLNVKLADPSAPAAPPVPFTGVLDRVDRSEADGGALAVVDYKTGKAPALKYAQATNARILDDAFFQLRVYALLASEQLGETPARLRLLYLQGPTVLEQPHAEAELARTRAELLAVAREISRAAATHVFEPKTGPLCDWCAFKERCPAFHPEVVLPPPTTAA